MPTGVYKRTKEHGVAIGIGLVKHGHTIGQVKSGAFKSWDAMIQRCTNKNHKKYGDYGGRGISVCERWKTYINFYEDMGDRPEGLELDRIDNEKGYSKENCKWSTRREQMLNRRNATLVFVNGVRIPFDELASMFGLYSQLLRGRIFRKNWPLEKALLTPIQKP